MLTNSRLWLKASVIGRLGQKTFLSTPAAVNAAVKTKHRVPQKKASKLLSELKMDEFELLRNGREYPVIKAGDSIQIEKLPFATSKEVDVIKGVVIAKTNRLTESSIYLANVEYGTPVFRRVFMYDPLVKSIKVLQEAFIHKGLKRVRRSKIYYLLDRHPDNYTVK